MMLGATGNTFICNLSVCLTMYVYLLPASRLPDYISIYLSILLSFFLLMSIYLSVCRCREDNGCRDDSYCNGSGTACPPSILKPNKTVCNEEFVCFQGVSELLYCPRLFQAY